MMTTVGKYSYINAKVRTMRSYFLDPSVFKAMAVARDLKELFSILSKTRYREIVERLGYPDAVSMERELFISETRQLLNIQKSCKDDVYDLVSLLLERFEAEKLKIILRVWHQHGRGEEVIIREKIIYNIPVETLIYTENLNNFIDLLHDTPFFNVLSEASSAYLRRKTLFPLEMAIDRDIFTRLWNAVEALNRKDRRIGRRLLGIEIDLKNLDWINRFRHYYNLSSSEIGEVVLPHGYRLEKKKMRDIVTGGSVSDILAEMARGTHIGLPEEQDERLNLGALEKFLYQVLLREARRAFGDFPFSIGAIFGYYYLMRIESKNICTLLQAKRYSYNAERTEALLVL